MSQSSGSSLAYAVGEHSTRAYLAVPPSGSGPGVVVLHAWWGLTEMFERVCDRLAAAGYVAFAPDLLQGRVSDTVEGAERNLSEQNRELTNAIVLGAIDQLRAQAKLKGGAVGVLGFSMGAPWALRLAEAAPDDITAAVLFYGAADGDFNVVRAAVLGHFAEQDEWEPLEYVRQMEDGLRAAGRDVTLHIYPEASHWFFEDNRPDAYHPASAELAWERTLAFLDANLRSHSANP